MSLVRKVNVMEAQPNQYTALVERYWTEYFPDRVAQMENPEGFFRLEAQRLADRVAELWPELADRSPEGEEYQAQVGRLNAARRQAEEIAFAEFLPTPDDEDLTLADPAADEESDQDTSTAGTSTAEGSLMTDGSTTVWVPTTDVPADPTYQTDTNQQQSN